MAVSEVTKEQIIDGFHTLGVVPGTDVIVHSSLKSFGHVSGGAQTVIEALMECITPEGTLMMPSFNHGSAFAKGAAGYYHPGQTPTVSGAIPDLFWRMPGVCRSLNPTHAFAAWGKHSRRYTEAHHRTVTMGPQSPLGLLQADGGFCLLLGVGFHANTFHHVVEMSMKSPCLGVRTEAYPVVLASGEKVEGRTWGWREKNCPFTDEGRYYGELAAQGLQRQVLIGDSRVTFFSLQDCYDVVADFLQEGKDGFPPCSGCSIRPRQAEPTVASDWDGDGECLLPDSAAHNY